MAKASLSSLVGHVPNCRTETCQYTNWPEMQVRVHVDRPYSRGTHHEPDGSLLINVDGDIGALDPGVGAQMSQSHVRVSARKQTLVHLYREHTASTLEFISLSGRNRTIGEHRRTRSATGPAGFYLGTNESVFCSVVGSSSNREAISFP